MNIYLITEQSNQSGQLTFNQKAYRNGLISEAQNSKSKLLDLNESELNIPLTYFSFRKCRPVVIVMGHSKDWLSHCSSVLLSKSIHPLVISPLKTLDSPNISTISVDNTSSIAMLCQYFITHGRKRTAYYGYNPNSFDDIKQYNAFKIYKEIYNMEEIHPYCDAYINLGSLNECNKVFLSRLHSYDSVICSNPISASVLLHALSETSVTVPRDLFVAAIGSSPLADVVSPTLTTVDVDSKAIGRKTIKLYQFLTKHTDISSLSAEVQGKITPRESTFSFDAPTDFPIEQNTAEFINSPLYSSTDENYAELENIEVMLSACDPLDKKILYSMIKGETIAQFAEEHYISEDAVKYRLRNLIKASHSKSKKSLTDKLSYWLDVSSFQ